MEIKFRAPHRLLDGVEVDFDTASDMSWITDMTHWPTMRTSPIHAWRPFSSSTDSLFASRTSARPRATTSTPTQRDQEMRRLRMQRAATTLSSSSRPLMSISAIDAAT